MVIEELWINAISSITVSTLMKENLIITLDFFGRKNIINLFHPLELRGYSPPLRNKSLRL